MNLQTAIQNKTADWLRSQILLNASVIKYGVVGCTGILVNLATMALLFTNSSQQGWMQSGVANIVSTASNFVFHNVWTFSDQQQRGLRLVRGFLSFAFVSVIGIGVTTVAYVGFTRVAEHLTITNFHLGALGIVLSSQFVALLLGGSVTYVLNREFTWARTKESAPAQEI